MTSKEFKKTVFGSVATQYGFTQAYGGWYKESEECTAVLALQKSYFGDYFVLRIMVFVKGAWGRSYLPDKELMDMPHGHVNSSSTEKYANVFDFDNSMSDAVRVERLNDLFKNHISPLIENTLTRAGIRAMAAQGTISLMPALVKELERLE